MQQSRSLRRVAKPRFSRSFVVLCVATFALSSVGCRFLDKVPETGRRRAPLQYSEQEMAQLGAETYESILREQEPVTGGFADMVTRVGERIAKTTGKDYDWQFALLDAPDNANAFCLPGGKVAVYSGLLPIARTEAGLSVVLSHEIAHATLQHGNERMSQPALKRLIGLPVSFTAKVWDRLAPRSRRLVMGAFGVGHVVGEFLPYTQEHEYEADVVGLRYMHAAGYDVNEAPAFWQRMLEAHPESLPSDPLSTHPDAKKRIVRLQKTIAAEYADDKSP